MLEEIEQYQCLETLPSELILYIFENLSGNDLMKCRQVCSSWKLIVDEIVNNDSYWLKLCKKEYGDIYLAAKTKSYHELTWFDLYRNLYSWRRLGEAVLEEDEFASASNMRHEVRNVEVLANGILGVHTKSAIEFFDIHTLKPAITRNVIRGDYAKYTENEYAIILQTYQLDLYVIPNKCPPESRVANTVQFQNVKHLYVIDSELYYVKLNDEIHICNLKEIPTTNRFIKRAEDQDGVMSLGYKNGCLHVLTFQRNIYTVINKDDLVFRQSLTSEPNLLNLLHKYNFLEQLDWRVYFQWMFVLRHSMPDGSMRDIICIRPYGDVFFVGSNFGVLCIFHKPYINGELNIFNSEPLFHFNFMERCDIPVLATCPILHIDVTEMEHGHIVYVAMPKKVALLKFTHNFMHTVSWEVNPIGDAEAAMEL